MGFSRSKPLETCFTQRYIDLHPPDPLTKAEIKKLRKFEKRKRRRQNRHRPKARRLWNTLEEKITLHNQRAKGTLTVQRIWELFDNQRGQCFYCSTRFPRAEIPSRAYFHIEHKIPVCRGGRNDRGNVVLACERCNLEKFTSTADEYLKTRQA